jgi:hypothetical protein
VYCVLRAELAVLFYFDPVGIVFLVLHGVVVSLLALSTCHNYLDSHENTSSPCAAATGRAVYLYICRKVHGIGIS